MAKKYVIDRTQLPYDAMVADESWLIPIEEDDTDGDKGTETDTDSDQRAGGESGQTPGQ